MTDGWRMLFGVPLPVLRFISLHQFEAEFPSNNRGGLLKSRQGNGMVSGIEQPVERGAARVHAPCHLGFGETLLLHGIFNLPRDHALRCRRADSYNPPPRRKLPY